MAIARHDGGKYVEPVAISAFDGTANELDGAELVEVDDHTYSSVTIGAWAALATTSSPTILVEGNIGVDRLARVLSDARVITNGPAFSVALVSLPEGYAVVAGPHVLAADPSPRRSLASGSARLSINEVSDMVDPLLHATRTGADLNRHQVGDAIAWSGTTSATEPISFLVWSPQPGVVFEISTTDVERPVDDLVDLANHTRVAALAEWQKLYPD